MRSREGQAVAIPIDADTGIEPDGAHVTQYMRRPARRCLVGFPGERSGTVSAPTSTCSTHAAAPHVEQTATAAVSRRDAVAHS